MNDVFDARIVILNFNGRKILEACIPSIVQAVNKSSYRLTVTLLDNGSADDSEEWIKKNYPTIAFVKAPKNEYLCSFNDYARKVSEKILILLNNDLRVEEDFADSLIETIRQYPDACFAASQSWTFDGSSYEGSRSRMEFRNGLIWGSARFKNHEKNIQTHSHTMQCGYGAFDREKFLELGGYDSLFLPGTMEDSDLCFRAYQKGWRGYYCPNSRVYHMGQASFSKKFGARGIERMNRRNNYLFIWKNIASIKLKFFHYAWLPIHLIKNTLFFKWHLNAALMDAWSKRKDAISRRGNRSNKGPHLSDEEIFNLSRELA